MASSAGAGSQSRVASLGFGRHMVHVTDEGDGEPVIILHSSGMSARQWRRLGQQITASGMRAIAPDLLGNGRSSGWLPDEPFSFERDVELVVALIDRVGDRLGEPVHLVGHSYGGFIALRVALRTARARTPLLRSLALYDPVAFGVLRETDADARANLDRVSFASRGDDLEPWLAGFVDYWNGAGAWQQLPDATREEFRRVGWVVHEGARTLVEDHTRAETYAAIECPVLLATGSDSPLAARRVIDRLAAVLRATVVVIEGAGHMGPLTHTRRVNTLIVAHLTGLSAQAQTT